MPEWWPALLLFVFVTHMPFFAWRWWRTGERRHAATTLTFSLLIAATGLRLFAPEWAWWGTPLHRPLRGLALASAVLSLGLLLAHWLRRSSKAS